MGVNDRAKDTHEENKRAKRKQARSRRGEDKPKYDARSIDWYAIIALTEAICNRQGALRIGFTRDGGALALGIYLGDDYATEYIRPDEDLRDACAEVSDAWLGRDDTTYSTRLRELTA